MTSNRDDLVNNCIDTILTRAKTTGVKTDEERKDLISTIIVMYQSMMGMSEPFTHEEVEHITRTVEYNLSVNMNAGSALLAADYKPWYFERKNQIQPRFWDRYRRMLSRKLPFNVMGELDVTTSKIIDYAGDPTVNGTFQRRGLVVGDVQSGKTNCYLGVINKALDAGYNFIIILTGITESLRVQTQIRVDSGVTGFNSDPEKRKKAMGVGLLSERLPINTITTILSDFKDNYKSITLSSPEPVLLVIKKNVTILQHVYEWLKPPEGSAEKIDKSLLMIDDEADNASIDTGTDEITRTNKNIRKILGLFNRASYVGYTATPYANIFVDPFSYDEMVKEDLFPKDFIYSMWAPSNYIGPREIFEPEGKHHYMLKTIPNEERLFEGNLKHKKTAIFSSIPKSLKKAIAAFFIGCTMRDLKGHNDKPMAMMIHISRFIDVQDSVLETIIDAITNLRADITSYYAYPEEEALKHDSIEFLHDVWLDEFSELSWPHNSWVEIQRNMLESTHSIKLMKINSKSEDGTIDYNKNPGFRGIVVGGNALSRGLTLEGLMVSYFYRESKQYDSLLQMGRWFGYKDEFAEVCRVWTNPSVQNWFGYIGRVNNELKIDIDDMCHMKKTPMDYGLRVQEDMVGLMMTSRQKMTTSNKEFVVKSLAGGVHDTMYVYVDKELTLRNHSALSRFYGNLDNHAERKQDGDHGNVYWRNVPRYEILQLLHDFHVPSKNVWYSYDEISKFIEVAGHTNWDVVVMSKYGKDKKVSHVDGMDIYCPERNTYTYKQNSDPNVIVMGNRNLITPTDPKVFLEESTVRQIAEARKETGKSPSAKEYMIEGRNPILMIYNLDLGIPDDNEVDSYSYSQMISNLNGLKPVGFALGFPSAGNDSEKKFIKYRTNMIYQRLKEDDEY